MDNRINLSGPAGTRDFFPEDMLLREWLFNKWKSISQSYGFVQYDGPVVENAELYTRKGGDDILNEMYSFDKDGVQLALRPEITPTAARMVMTKLPVEVSPLKWFTVSQCWRYENTTRGRKREHYQWNADIFNASPVTSEVELLTMIVAFFKSVGLTSNDVTIKISNRMILQVILKEMGIINELFLQACVIIDKISKLSKEEISLLLKDKIGLTVSNIETIYKLCETTNFDDMKVFFGEDNPIFSEIKQIFNIAKETGLSEWLSFDASIIRGLSYYTGTVFEAFLKNSTLKRALCGGGRYDDLLEKYNYRDKVPAIGFGFGDVVILEALKELNLLPELNNKVDYLVIPYDMSFYGKAVNISERLRTKGYKVETYNSDQKKGRISDAYNYANKKQIRHVLLLAPDEWNEGKMCYKDMSIKKDKKDGARETVNIDDFF
jgi:histidyl-tRNA synthetase